MQVKRHRSSSGLILVIPKCCCWNYSRFGHVLLRSPWARILAGQGNSWPWVLPNLSIFGLMPVGQQGHTTTIHWQSWIPNAGAWCWKTGHGRCWRKQRQTAWFKIQCQANALMGGGEVSAMQNMIFFSTGGALKSRVRSSAGKIQAGDGKFRLVVWDLEHLMICFWLYSAHTDWTYLSTIRRQGFQGLVWQQNAEAAQSLFVVLLTGRIRLTSFFPSCAKAATLFTWAEQA